VVCGGALLKKVSDTVSGLEAKMASLISLIVYLLALLMPPITAPALQFHAPVGAMGGLGWGDSLVSLKYQKQGPWNESVVFFAGEPPQGGFPTVSVDGGTTWQRGGNWSKDFCLNDKSQMHTFVVAENGDVHTFGNARGSGATAGSYSSFNSTSSTTVRWEPASATVPASVAAATATCVQKPVVFRGLPVPVHCNETGVLADCFGYFGSSVRLADGSWLQTAAAPWLGGEFGVSPAQSGMFVFRSVDSYTWDYLSTVATAAEFPDSGEGPSENAMVLTACKGDHGAAAGAECLLAVVRMDGNDGARWGNHKPKNFYRSASTNSGKTWSRAREMLDVDGVGIGTARPRLTSVGGSLLLTGSRILTSNDSDYYLWHNADGQGERFVAHSLTYHHNLNAADPKMKIGAWCNMTNYTTAGQACAGYTSIVPLGGRNALAFYSAETVGFGTHPGNSPPVGDGGWMFSMRVTLTVAKSDDASAERAASTVVVLPAQDPTNQALLGVNWEGVVFGWAYRNETCPKDCSLASWVNPADPLLSHLSCGVYADGLPPPPFWAAVYHEATTVSFRATASWKTDELEPAASFPAKPRSSLRWLSFYNDCDWGQPNSTLVVDDERLMTMPAQVHDRATPSSPFSSLPLVEGICVPRSASNRGMCWLDKLQTLRKYNSSAMLILQTSGPVFCGKTGCVGCKYICPDDCDDPSLSPPRPPAYINWSSPTSARGAGAGTCGLEWVRRTLRWARPLVAGGLLPGFMLGDELSGGMDRGNYTALTDVIHTELEGLEHFVYTNESPHMYLGETVPSGIDVISFDGYGACLSPGTFCGKAAGVNKSEANWHRALYETRVYPHLLPHQRVAVVPGFFGCSTPDQPGGCSPGRVCH
jgi:hypothetical protein